MATPIISNKSWIIAANDATKIFQINFQMTPVLRKLQPTPEWQAYDTGGLISPPYIFYMLFTEFSDRIWFNRITNLVSIEIKGFCILFASLRSVGRILRPRRNFVKNGGKSVSTPSKRRSLDPISSQNLKSLIFTIILI